VSAYGEGGSERGREGGRARSTYQVIKGTDKLGEEIGMLGLSGHQLMEEEGGMEGGVEGWGDVEGEEGGDDFAESGVKEGRVVVGATLGAHFVAEPRREGGREGKEEGGFFLKHFSCRLTITLYAHTPPVFLLPSLPPSLPPSVTYV